MVYKYCSICAGSLKLKKGNLVCEKCGFINFRNPRPTVTGLILHKNKLLLTRRGEKPFKGWWDLPGGFIDRNEGARDAICRELKEETGLDVKIKKIFGIYAGKCSTGPDKNYSILSIVYLLQSAGDNLGAFDDVVESRWFIKKDIPSKIAFDSNQKIIKDFLKIWK